MNTMIYELIQKCPLLALIAFSGYFSNRADL